MTKKNSSILSSAYLNFKKEITARIRSAQYEALKAVNKEIIALYWEVGKRITEQQTTLGWGKSVVENLSRDIQKEFPGIQGFGVRNMWDMARFYTEYQSNEFLQPLVAEISWSKRNIQSFFRIARSLQKTIADIGRNSPKDRVADRTIIVKTVS